MERSAAIAGQDLDLLILSGLATGASWLCYFRALQIGPASQVAPVDKLSLLLVAVFAFVFLGERPSPREWLGIAMVGAGCWYWDSGASAGAPATPWTDQAHGRGSPPDRIPQGPSFEGMSRRLGCWSVADLAGLAAGGSPSS